MKIGDENQRVDEDERNPVQLDLDGPGYRARRDFHFATEERIAKLWGKFAVDASLSDPALGSYRTSTRDQAFYGLGTYLHTRQDSFSHVGFGPRSGHMFGRNPHYVDKTYNDVLKANIMARDTYDALAASLKAFRFVSPSPVSWDKIKGYVNRFNKARSRNDETAILSELRDFIDKERLNEMLKGRFGCIYGEGLGL